MEPKLNIQDTEPQLGDTEKGVVHQQKDVKTSNLENNQENLKSSSAYKVEEIKRIKDDSITAHTEEFFLYHSAIEFVESGGYLTPDMAKEILKTKKIKFGRNI